MFFTRRDPKTELEGLDKAMEILNERYEKKLITIDEFQKKAFEFGKKREKCLKRMAKEEEKRDQV